MYEITDFAGNTVSRRQYDTVEEATEAAKEYALEYEEAMYVDRAAVYGLVEVEYDEDTGTTTTNDRREV